MNSPRQWQTVDLCNPSQYLAPSPVKKKEFHTVFKAKIATTLLHDEPVLGCHANSRASALASHSTRNATFDAEYARPDNPHTKGTLECTRGDRPYVSFSTNSLIGIESGMVSRGSSGTHEGG